MFDNSINVARREQVYFNYSEALKKAERLEAIAEEINSRIDNDLSEKLDYGRNVWKSDTANIYFDKYNKIVNDLKECARNYKRVAEVIRTTAKRNYDAEIRIIEIASKRVYKN